jgi:DNA-binding CsgD family transcriptional regulator
MTPSSDETGLPVHDLYVDIMNSLCCLHLVAPSGPLDLISTLSAAPSRPIALDPSVSSPLTERERMCLALLADGLSAKLVADRLGITRKTVEFHLQSARRKLQAKTSVHAVARAMMLGLLPVSCEQSADARLPS